MSKLTPRILPYGDHALLVQYDADGFSQEVSEAVHTLAHLLRKSRKTVWREIVPAYDSLVVTFDAASLSLDSAKRRIEDALIRGDKSQSKKKETIIDIPVYYGGENGPDLETICKSSGLSAEKVITLHSAKPYRVCMMGFIPGFTFLSEAPKKLHHPRQKTPRAKVPAGSVGIANWQTGIYGLESPGGWQIIGRTPLSIFDKSREAPFLLKAGDRIRFVPTDDPS